MKALYNFNGYTLRSATVTSMTGLESITTIITRRRTALFGHVARLDNNVPANRALDLAINVRNGHPPDPSWMRPRGRPRSTQCLGRRCVTIV